MNFTMIPDLNKKTLTVPRSALTLGDLDTSKYLSADVEEGYILLVKPAMTAKNLVTAIEGLTKKTAEMTEQLKVLCRRHEFDADDDGELDCCGDCGEDCDGLRVPPCMLMEAGVDPESALEVSVECGRLVITPAKERCDALCGVSQDLLLSFRAAGISPEALRTAMEEREARFME